MNKPGEYKIPDSLRDFKGIHDLKRKIVASVEKAHAERNCGNCGVGMHSDNSAMWCNKHYIEITDSGILKCNEWKPKEADNGDA